MASWCPLSLHAIPLFCQLLSQVGNTGWYKTLKQEMKQQSLDIPLQPILIMCQSRLLEMPNGVLCLTSRMPAFASLFISHFSICLPLNELAPSWLNATMDSIDAGIWGQPTLVLLGPRKSAKGNISTRRGHSSVRR